jgi:hypothetical protein
MTEAIIEAQSFDLLRMDREIVSRQARRRLMKVSGWVGVIALSLSSRRMLGWLVAAGAVYGLVHELLDWRDERPDWKKDAHHRSGGLGRRLLTPRRVDQVERGSEQSFPASDPPAAR